MAAKISIGKFHGRITDNPSKFLAEIQSYSTLLGITNKQNDKMISIFHLHLDGPARTWFEGLQDYAKNTWATLQQTFQDKYMKFFAPKHMIETEIFHNTKLLQGQTLEDFHSKLLEKALKLEIPEADILLRFMTGLPEKLCFFVRVSQPANHNEALETALMGEACGYRKHETLNWMAPEVDVHPTVAAAAKFSPPNHQLERKVDALTKSVEQLTQLVNQQQTRRQQPTIEDNPQPDEKCSSCKGRGHPVKECNWNGEGRIRPSTYCQLCRQQGHGASKCIVYLKSAPKQQEN